MGWVDEVRVRATLLPVAQRYAELRPAGREWRGPCPLHGGTAANFVVYPETNTYHCFVCRSSGDVFSLLQRLEGLDFVGAARQLAGELGVATGSRETGRARATEEVRQEAFTAEAGSFWGHAMDVRDMRHWGLGAAQLPNGEWIGTIPLMVMPGRTVVGWYGCRWAPDAPDALVGLGVLPESDPIATPLAMTYPMDWARRQGDSADGAPLVLWNTPLEAVQVWLRHRVPGMAAVSLSEAVLRHWAPTFREVGVSRVVLPSAVGDPADLDAMRAVFQLDHACWEAGVQPLLRWESAASWGAEVWAETIARAIEEEAGWSHLCDSGVLRDCFELRVEYLSRVWGNRVWPVAGVLERLGETLRVVRRGGQGDDTLFQAYLLWLARAARGSFHWRRQFLQGLSAPPAPPAPVVRTP